MTDIRSLLRSELATRSLSSTSQKPTSKKRKASSEELQDPRVPAKKARSTGSDAQEQTQQVKPAPLPKRYSAHVASPPELDTVLEETSQEQDQEAGNDQTDLPVSNEAEEAGPLVPTEDNVDENEWAAFERDVATPPPEASAATKSALYSAASIQAKPLSAAELAAQAREEESNQRGKKDVEVAEEKEEAAQRLEEEFDEMEEFEERVKRLRQRREELRQGSAIEDADAEGSQADAQQPAAQGVPEDDVEEDSEDEAEEEEEWMWGHG